jgi:hypothetical protein
MGQPRRWVYDGGARASGRLGSMEVMRGRGTVSRGGSQAAAAPRQGGARALAVAAAAPQLLWESGRGGRGSVAAAPRHESQRGDSGSAA